MQFSYQNGLHWALPFRLGQDFSFSLSAYWAPDINSRGLALGGVLGLIGDRSESPRAFNWADDSRTTGKLAPKVRTRAGRDSRLRTSNMRFDRRSWERENET